MPINRVDIKNYLVFSGELSVDFCPGVNVLIGGNGTGKTTLLKCLYDLKWSYARLRDSDNYLLLDSDGNELFTREKPVAGIDEREWGKAVAVDVTGNFIYIPEKDILEHAKGLLPFIEQKQTGFNEIYRDLLVAAQDVPTSEQNEMQKEIGIKIADKIGGYIEWVQNDGSFYTVRTDGKRIPFATEASGFKKLGFLGLLVTTGQLGSGSVLLWDEPENSLNPGLVPFLVEILLELARNRVQIFIATHDYGFARYFDVRKNKDVPVQFNNLLQLDNGQIVCHSTTEYIKIPRNHLETASTDLFKAVVGDALEIQDDE